MFTLKKTFYCLTNHRNNFYSTFIQKHLCIVGFSGKRRAGKDQGADLMIDAVHTTPDSSLWIVKRSIGYLPKKLYAAKNNIDFDRILNDDKFKEKHREGIIELATKEREEIPVIWVHFCFEQIIEDFLNSGASRGVCFISDVRFLNEIKFLQSKNRNNEKFFGGNIFLTSEVIRIHADDQVREERGWKYCKEIDNHPSETELDNSNIRWSFEVPNHSNDLFQYRISLQPLVELISAYIRKK